MPQINNASPTDEQPPSNAFRMQDQSGDGDLSLQKPAQPRLKREHDLEDDADSHSFGGSSEDGDLSFAPRSFQDDTRAYNNGEPRFSADLSDIRPSGDMGEEGLRSPTRSYAEVTTEHSHDIGEAVMRPSMESDAGSIAGGSSTRDSHEITEGGYSLFRSAHEEDDSASEELGETTNGSPPVIESRPGSPARQSIISTKSTSGTAIESNHIVDKETDPVVRRSPALDSTVTQEIPGHAEGVSEWSHQQLAPQPVEKPKKSEDDEWQDMPAYAPYDIYDDDGKLIAREAVEESGQVLEDANLGGAARGYTRVQIDEDAQSATSMDEDTAYLFKNKAALADEHDEELRDPLAQMAATKTLLTENQTIAYVGVVRLAMAEMMKDVEAIERTRGSKKDVDLALDAMRLWGQKMMVRIYAHMELDPAEQMMIEQLSQHGLKPDDLTPTLMQNARVKNPVMNKESTKSTTDEDLKAQNEPSVEAEAAPSTHINGTEDSTLPPPPYEQTEEPDMPGVRTPSQLPKTDSLDIDIRWTVLCDLFLILISDSIYDARSRVLLERVGSFLSVQWLDICRFEKRISDALEMQEAAQKEDWDEAEHLETRRKRARKKKLVLMGLATVGGGLVIGLSAGLLAPVIGAGLAAGFTTIGVTGTGTFLAGAGGAAVIGTGAAVTGGSIGGRAANRRMGAVKTYEYRPLHNNKRVNLIVTVAGWMNGKVDDVRLPYSTVDPIMGDIYSILWEPEMLRSMGDTINILATEALTQGLQQILGSTILISLMAALQLPIVLTKLAYLIDNPWSVSQTRADMAGLILADSLIDRNLGARPITLVGFSLGSRLIFSCLRELAKRGAIGLVQNVYLFGSPVVVKKDEYLRAKTVVSGRFVNGYATNDWILGYLFRATAGGIMRVAGLAKVDIPGIENIDVTEFVPGHMAYRKAMPRILREVGWAIESDDFSEIEDPDPDNHEKRQRELIYEIEEARKDLQQKPSKKFLGLFRTGKQRAAKKKEWETYEQKEGPGEGSSQSGSVLFDVEAIRREAVELAVQGIEIKELQTTAPTMNINANQRSTSDSSRGGPNREPTPVNNGSHHDLGISTVSTKDSGVNNKAATSPTNHSSSYYDEEDPEAEENVTMTFGSPVRKRETITASSSVTAVPDRTHRTSPSAFSHRAETVLDTHQTSTSFDLPPQNRHWHAALTADYDPLERSPSSPPVFGGGRASSSKLAPAWDDDGDLGSHWRSGTNGGGAQGNAWARDNDDDDDEFGREKHVEMTFE